MYKRQERDGDYQNMIGITFDTDEGERYIAGTLFTNRRPRIVNIDTVKLEAGLGENMLFISNEDKPGLIGNLGKLFGDQGINIANFHLGRSKSLKEKAIALVEVDNVISDNLLDQVNKLPSVINARILNFSNGE